MKITNVYTEKYKWPKEKPIANGTHVFTHNELNLLVIETDEGITGYGTSWEINFAERMGQAILGEDPLIMKSCGKRPMFRNLWEGKATVYGVYRRLILHYGILRLKLPICRCTA